jgi:hypothetical protein
VREIARAKQHLPEAQYLGIADGLSIGSGVTAAASKSLVKQRQCASGMRWKKKGARYGSPYAP